MILERFLYKALAAHGKLQSVKALHPLGLLLVAGSCGAPHRPSPLSAATFTGTITYDGGKASGRALLRLTDLGPKGAKQVLSIDDSGHFSDSVPPGDYAVSVSTDSGFGWLEKVSIPASRLSIKLRTDCHRLRGNIKGHDRSLHVRLERQSNSRGDTFEGLLTSSGAFQLCLPEGQYVASVTGDKIAANLKVDIPGSDVVSLDAMPASAIKSPPDRSEHINASFPTLLADIERHAPHLIGMGEATHGTAEFSETRQQLTMELIKHANLRLILLENDAIASRALDDYINGADLDLGKIVSDLGFWTSDTFEFHHFLQALRTYNSTASDKVHIWGIDIQNTTLPVEVLLRASDSRSISKPEQDLLARLKKRGAGIKEFSEQQHASIDALLTTLSEPRSQSADDFLVAVAARSLASQLKHWVGDTEAWNGKRRDIGMASLAEFIATRATTGRACLWAHDAHISKERREQMLGYLLSTSGLRYYAIGFYMQQGSARAWDIETKIGVISHVVPPAPIYSVEHVLMSASGKSQIAWLPFGQLPQSLSRWLGSPRYVRELYAIYEGEQASLILRSVREAFDAMVVVPNGRDSSPTPTGVRRAD